MTYHQYFLRKRYAHGNYISQVDFLMAKIYSPYLATGTIETVTNNGFKKIIQYVCEQTGNTITVRPAPEMSE